MQKHEMPVDTRFTDFFFIGSGRLNLRCRGQCERRLRVMFSNLCRIAYLNSRFEILSHDTIVSHFNAFVLSRL